MGLEGSMLMCKIISKKKITNNQEVLKSVNIQARNCYALVESLLQDFEPEFSSFMSEELTPFVSTQIENERFWREQKNETGRHYFQTKMNLNPFVFA